MKRIHFFLPSILLSTSLIGTSGDSIAAVKPMRPTRPAFEPEAHALLKRVFDHYHSLKSYSGTMHWTRSGTSLDLLQKNLSKGQNLVRVAQPKLYLSCRIDNSAFGHRFFDDGSNIYINAAPDQVIRVSHLSLDQNDLWKYVYGSDFGLKELLQGRNSLQPFGAYVKSIGAGPERRKGEAHVIVQLKAPGSQAQIDYFLGRQDLSLHGLRLRQTIEGKTLDQTEEHTVIKFNPALTSSEIDPDAEVKRMAEESETSAALSSPTPAAPNSSPSVTSPYGRVQTIPTQAEVQIAHRMREAIIQGETEALKAIVEGGGDVNAQTEQGNTALTAAAEYGQLDMARYLLNKGANINLSTTKNNTPLIFAAWKGQTSVVKLLCEKGADVKLRTNTGGTALTFAASVGKTDIVRILLQYGADVKAQQNNGGTAYKIAVANGFPKTAKVIADAGGQ